MCKQQWSISLVALRMLCIRIFPENIQTGSQWLWNIGMVCAGMLWLHVSFCYSLISALSQLCHRFNNKLDTAPKLLECANSNGAYVLGQILACDATSAFNRLPAKYANRLWNAGMVCAGTCMLWLHVSFCSSLISALSQLCH